MLDWLFEKTPLHFMVQSFWRDEGFSYIMAHKSIPDMIVTTAHDFNPPLYYFLLHFWILIFGPGEIAMRSMSLIFYGFTIYVFYLLIKNILKIQGFKLGLYTLLFATNPVLVYYAFEARMYMMFSFFATLSFYFFLQKNKIGYIIATTLGLYSHYYFSGVLLTQGAYILLTEKKELKHLFEKFKIFIIPVVTFLPWLIYISKNLITQTNSFWMIKLTSNDFYRLPAVLFNGYEIYYNYYDKYILWTSFVITLIIIFGIFLRKKNDKLLLLSVIWSFGFYLLIALISIVKPIFVPRYLIFSTIGLNLFFVISLERMKSIMKYSLIALLFFLTYQYTTLEVKDKKKGDFRNTVTIIKSMMKPGDKIYVKDAGNYFVAGYYAPEEDVYVYEYLDRIPAYVGLAAIPHDKIVQQLPEYPHKAFVIVNDTDYEIKTNYK